MSVVAFDTSAQYMDLSSRVVESTSVVGSPATNAETIVCSITLPGQVQFASGVLLIGWVAYTVGTNGVSGTVRVRQTSTSGTIVAASGALTETAATLVSRSILGFDTAPAAGQVYKLTLTVGSGSAVSTVSAVGLVALAI